MKRKAISALLCIGLLCLGACSKNEAPGAAAQPTTDAHVHTAAGNWERNPKIHWQLCECGEKINEEAHNIQDSRCEICNSDIWDFGDFINIDTYYGEGDSYISTSFDLDGNILSETKCECEYDADGNLIKQSYWYDGFCAESTFYAPGPDGESIPTGYVGYNSDGSWYEGKYDEYGNIYSFIDYMANGEKFMESVSEFTVTEDGGSLETKRTEIYYEDGVRYDAEYNEYADIISRHKTDLEGTTVYLQRWERDYDEEGKILWEKMYHNDVLSSEIVGYAEYEDEHSYMRFPTKTIDYYNDGSRFEKVFNERGETAEENTHRPDGSIETSNTYEYEYTPEGDRSCTRVYENGRLTLEKLYAMSEDGWSYKCMETEYFEDGSKSVTEFDEYEEPISATIYDAAGNEVK